MYLRKIRNVNTGPISDVSIDFPFQESRPMPLVLVGENGAGKSELLSFIVDSLYEIAGDTFIDVREPDERQGYQYYKSITPTEIKIGTNGMYSYVVYKTISDKQDTIGYVLKSGNLKIDDFRADSGFELSEKVNWEDIGNEKKKIFDKKIVEKVFDRSVFCFFAPDRYERPLWMGEKYFDAIQSEHFSLKQRWSNNLGRPISVENASRDTISWLLDIIADSRCDVEPNGPNSYSIAHVEIGNLLLLKQSRQNVEKIMSEIVGEDVYFGLNDRSNTNSRFNIKRTKDNSIFAPALESLSTGQLALFNMFATIVRYADWNNINNSISLDDITGVVVIDEIELHLHADLQRNVLPKLLKLFSKVQFILSTHSPLFLLGMDESYGDENYQIIEMPEGNIISSEAYSQFQNAYSYFSLTRKYQKEISAAVAHNTEKPLVVTEGSTDWKHIKAALQRIKSTEKYREKYSALDFDLLEYNATNSSSDSTLKLEMGNSQLRESCKGCSIMPQPRKLIFIADADDEKTSKMMSNKDGTVKYWGNNVYSFVLPVPGHRLATPQICVEHLYYDSEIKAPMIIEGVERRLYLGSEFDENGISADGKLFCKDRNSCGQSKICIIDGTESKRVFAVCARDVNIALSKMSFADAVLNGDEGFQNFSVEGFLPLFDTLLSILSQSEVIEE